MSENTLETDLETGLIRVMPEALANQIAAGEVVQRPSSALKELLENALDAGAGAIQVVVRESGRSLVQVIDDGIGMGESDARACFQRHATSKVFTLEDLERIRTLGFRGEALASIAAVSMVELRTRRREQASGTRVRIDGGTIGTVEPVASPVGTSVAVRQLFYNVPGRRNFLKTDATELRHLMDTVQALAISNAHVAFEVTHDDTEVMRLPASDAPFSEALGRRIADLFSLRPVEDLVGVEESTSYLAVRGFVGRSSVQKRSRAEQFLFVNGRHIRHRSLEHAVSSAYDGLLSDGSFPFFVLFLDVDPRHVDVNVHPAKAEVKFDDERGVYSMVRAVIGRALSEGDLAPQIRAGMPDLLAGDRALDGGYYPPSSPRSGEDLGSLSARLYGGGSVRETPGGLLASGSMGEEEVVRGLLEPQHLLWQIQDSYIVTPIRSGIMIVDQQAAHERVLYERALHSLRDGFGLSQQLLFPRTVDLTPPAFALMETLLPDMRSLGFDVEPFGGRAVLIRGVPADIRTGDERLVLEEVLAQYDEYARTLRLEGRENLARSIARRSAVPHGSRMDAREMRALIDQLFQCNEPYTCPNGRPTLQRITGDELAKRFGRDR